MKTKLSALLILLLCSSVALCQPVEKRVKVMVSPDHADWTYRPGEKTKFTVQVLKDGNPVKNVSVRYAIGLEKMEPLQKATIILENGSKTLPEKTLQQPGFLRCIATATVEGKEYTGLATAAFNPLDIQPVTTVPADFEAFWNKAKADAANIPMDVKMTLLPERCTEKVNVYHVGVQSYRYGSRIYGILSVPKKPGKYPAVLKVPGAGIRPYYGDPALAAQGFITFEIGIHGIPVNMEPGVYNDLMNGALNGYWNMNLDDKDNYFYKRVYLGCVRAVDYIFSLPEFDGSNLAVMGGSQGGALSIVTAALDNRVKWLVAFYPALCDITGYLHGRAGGWPHLFAKENLSLNNKKDRIENIQYYDVVNFARLVKVPGFYSWGFNDETCPPTSMYAAYNVINAPKTLFLALETGHWAYNEQWEKEQAWLIEKMK
jgi:cephalosporin-C deacetylase